MFPGYTWLKIWLEDRWAEIVRYMEQELEEQQFPEEKDRT
jgi:hypothetical protein